MWYVFDKHGYLLGSFRDVADAVLAFWTMRDACDLRFREMEIEP